MSSSFVTPWAAGHQASLSLTISQSLLKFISIESVMLSNHLILFHPLLLLPSIFPNIQGLFQRSQLFASGGQSIRASASVVPMNIQGWFPLNWCFALFAVQGPLKSLLECWNLKASICQCSAFLTNQLSHPYMTTGKTIALTRQSNVSAFEYAI